MLQQRRSGLGEPLVEALRELEAMPQVRLVQASIFDRAKPLGSKAQARGIVVKLVCYKKPIDQKCNDLQGDAACPTFVEAARVLRHEKVQEKHGSAECLEKVREAAAAEGGTSSMGSSTEPPRDAFAAMLGARCAIQRAQSALKQAEQSAEQRRAQAFDAQRQLKEVSFARLAIGLH